MLSKLVFGNALLDSQFYFLKQLKGRNRILLAGIGTGHLLKEIIKQDIASEIVCVDISEGMLEQTQKLNSSCAFQKSISLQYICSPIQGFVDEKKFDLIFFPYLLDCISAKDIITILARTKRQLNPSGKIIFTDFYIPQQPFLVKIYARLLVKILLLFFNAICKIGVKKLPDFDSLFSAQGFQLVAEKKFYRGILVTQMYALQ